MNRSRSPPVHLHFAQRDNRATSPPVHLHVGKKTPVHLHIKPGKKVRVPLLVTGHRSDCDVVQRLSRLEQQQLSCSEMAAGRPVSSFCSPGLWPTYLTFPSLLAS